MLGEPDDRTIGNRSTKLADLEARTSSSGTEEARHAGVKADLCGEPLDGPCLQRGLRVNEYLGMIATNIEPLIPVPAKLSGRKATAFGVLGVVVVDLGVALEAQRDRVACLAATTFGCGIEVIHLHPYAAEPMANTATAMT